MTETTKTKRCRVCGEAKILDEFHRDASRADDHGTVCKACNRIRSKARKKRRAERNRAARLNGNRPGSHMVLDTP